MSDTANKVTITRPGEGRCYNVLGAPITVMSSGDTRDLFFAHHPVPAGFGVPLHLHHDEDEMAYVVEGEITFETAEGETLAGPGTFVHLPRGVAHGFSNRSGKDALMVAVASEGGALESVFRELDEEARKAPLDGPTIGGVLARNRLELLAG